MPDGKSVSPKKYRCSEPKTQELLERVFTVPADDHESRRYDEKLSLPHRSTQAEEYTGSLKALFDHYLKKLREANGAMRHGADAGTPASESDGADAKPELANTADKKKSANTNLVPESPVKKLCEGLLNVLAEYHRGLPASAFNKFDRLMTEISRTHEMPRASLKDSTQANCLFRMRLIDEGLVYPRKEIFHPSTSCRHLIGTNRYSIPGYPTLYLTDSLTLAQRESGGASSAIVALFQLNRGFQLGIIELGIRPRDFDLNVESPRSKTSTSVEQLSGRAVQNYLIWFPLLAGCSFVRAHPGSPYADEYVLPQLLMQWIRMQSSGPGGATLPPNGGGGPRGNGPGPTGPTTERERAEIPLHQEEGITELMMAFTPTMDKLSGLYDQLDPELTEVLRNVPESLHTFTHTSRQLADMVIDAVRFVQTTHPDPEEIKQELDESGASERRVPLETLRERVNEQLKRYTSLRNAMARGGMGPDDPSLSSERRISVQKTQKLLRDSSAALYHARRNLNWLLNLPTRIIGVRYFSCKNDVAPTLGTNFAFPMEPVPGKNGKESSSLNEYFSWTNPVNTADFPTLEECEKYLTNLARDSHNLGNCDDGS